MLPTGLMLAIILTWSFNEGRTIYKEVLINATTKISCSPNEDIHLQLLHTPLHGPEKYVYTMGIIRYSSSRGVSMEKDSNTGPYHLVIPHARTEDAGLYKCQEDSSSRVFDSTELTVLESSPVCGSNIRPDGYVGPTTCKLTQEEMIFTCAVSFSGKPPQMTWKILNGRQSFSDSMCKTGNGRKNCSLIIKAESKYDGSIFNCQTKNSILNCSTEVIKIHYFENQKSPEVLQKKVGDKVNCSVKSNQILKFKWTRLQGNQYANSIENQELVILSVGLYRCEVEYRIRNVECSAFGTEVNANYTSTTRCETDQANALIPNITHCVPAKCSKGTKGTARTEGTTVIISVLVTTLVISMIMTDTNLGLRVHVKE